MIKLSQEQIFEIQRYGSEHNLPIKAALKELGYSEWTYYQSKKDLPVVTSPQSGFIPLKTCTSTNLSSNKSSNMTLEIRTVKGTEIRLISELNIEMVLNLISNV